MGITLLERDSKPELPGYNYSMLPPGYHTTLIHLNYLGNVSIKNVIFSSVTYQYFDFW